MPMAVVMGAIVGQAFDGTIVPMTAAMGVAGVLCFLSNRFVVGHSN